MTIAPPLDGQLPPGPRSPLLIQTFQQLFDPLTYLAQQRQRYGDVFTLRFAGTPPLVVIADPKVIQALFTANPKQFDSGAGNRAFLQSWVGQHSLLVLDGDRHARQRRLIMPPFHGDRMKSYGEAIQAIARQEVSEIPLNQPFIARNMTQRISLQVILRTVFGLSAGPRFDQMERRLTAMLDGMTGSVWRSLVVFLKPLQRDLGAWSPWGKFLREQRGVDELIYAEIAERRSSPSPGSVPSPGLGEDVLSLMMAARDEAGEPMGDQELRDELITLLIAGHETTATAIAWALYWVHVQPEVRRQLTAELQAWQAQGGELAAVGTLPYLSAVCAETLRIFPITLFTFARMPKVALDLAGYRFEPGTMLMPCVYLTHRREDLYPQAAQFRPERFLEQQFSPFEYLPFGGSNRRCLGMAFAQYEMKLAMATLLTQTSFELLEAQPVTAVRRGLTMAPAGGIAMVRRSRAPAPSAGQTD